MTQTVKMNELFSPTELALQVPLMPTNSHFQVVLVCGYVDLAFSLVYEFVLYANIVKRQPQFHVLNAKIVQWLTSFQGLLQTFIKSMHSPIDDISIQFWLDKGW